MPPQPSHSRAKSNARRSVTEFGSSDHIALQASGLYQTTNIQDRIQQWQAYGAAGAPAPDAVSLTSAPRSVLSASPDPEGHRDAYGDENQGKGYDHRHSRKARQGDNALRVRSASTPRKRVVSDEHWKAQRGPKASPKRDLRQDAAVGVENDGVIQHEDLPSATTARSSKKARAEREERRHRRAGSRSRKVTETKNIRDDNSDRDIRPETLPDSMPMNRTSMTKHLVPFANLDRSPVMTTYDDESLLEFGTVLGLDDDDQPYIKSKYAETLGRPPPSYENAQVRSKKGIFLNKTKEVLGIADPTPVQSNRLPSIEAWLDDQPDPFVESKMSKVRFEDEPLKPSASLKEKPSKQKSTSRKSLKPAPAVRDPNEIWNAIGSHTTVEPQRNLEDEHQTSAELEVPQEQTVETSPVSLKRQRAKASRPKRHTLQHVPSGIDQVHAEIVASGQDDPFSPPVKRQEERACPQTGPTRLSTIASVETFHEQPQQVEKTAEIGRDTTHQISNDEEMMRVLSRPSMRRARSTRRNRSVKINEQNTNPTKQILDNLAEEEAKYVKELRTLVEGVIPVLLQCVLSKSDTVAAAGLFTTAINISSDFSFSRPIIDMGIALERLKKLHDRLNCQNIDSLLSWCQTAHKAYSDYLKAWRLGFQDVVINLAPLDGSDIGGSEVMARDKNGDIVNGEGETVDIAYLMKRPLVNIRKIGRALSCLQDELPEHPVAAKIAEDYRELTAAAKTKHQQEKSRLEDEAAAGIDTTKCRDIRNLAPLPGAVIAKDKRVRARDCFDMTLFHSTGQRLDCKIELILRDNKEDSPDGGDVLLCQVDQTGRWLLFAPMALNHISARKGDSDSDLVLMVRGRAGLGSEWRELLALKAEDPEAVAEWMIMLGSNPLPPKLNRTPSFVEMKTEDIPIVSTQVSDPTQSTLHRVPSTGTIDIPIGEPSVLGLATTNVEEQKPTEPVAIVEKPVAKLSMGGGLQKKPVPEHWQYQAPTVARKPVAASVLTSDRSTISGYTAGSTSTYAPSSLAPMDHTFSSPQTPKKSRVEEQRYGPQVIPAASERPVSQSVEAKPAVNTTADTAIKATKSITVNEDEAKKINSAQIKSQKAVVTNDKSTSHTPISKPDEELPKISKLRGNSISSTPLTDSIRDTWSNLSGFGRKAVSQPGSPNTKETSEHKNVAQTSRSPLSENQNVSQRHSMPALGTGSLEEHIPPAPPQHKQMPTKVPNTRPTPILRPSEAQKRMDRENGRISHSPLRKEYTPSSASASENSYSDQSNSDDDSQTSEEFEMESYGYKPVTPPSRYISQATAPPSRSAPTAGTRTLAPSDSASQGPYRKVPSSADRPDVVVKRAIAMVCSWKDTGVWEPLVEESCSIVISPGLMEVFPMNEAHSGQPSKVQPPLAAFELTPIVPLRRPTGLDINIRSPPTPDSQIKTSNNIMFRSQSAAECEALYSMMNWARCNNQTYIELERSRPRPQPVVTFSNEEAPRPRSWFSFGGGVKRRNSYRVGNIPPSTMGESQATANTTSSAMSVFKRLSLGSPFNVNRSSVRRKSGLNTDGSLYSSSNGTGVDSSASTPPPSQLGMIPGRDGPNAPPTSAAAVNGAGMVHNMKIRLQIRQAQGWVTMGLSRLTILPAVKHSSDSPETSRPGSSDSNAGASEQQSRRASTMVGEPPQRAYRLSSANYTPIRLHGGGREKRVVVTAEKDPSRVLLDATLGESCFEKISHLGIALQVWKSDDEIRSRGGVGLGQNTKYLFHFFTAKECAWVFDLVGRYRYSNNVTN